MSENLNRCWSTVYLKIQFYENMLSKVLKFEFLKITLSSDQKTFKSSVIKFLTQTLVGLLESCLKLEASLGIQF